jgi:DNA-binding NarL/FixJ family response regulator
MQVLLADDRHLVRDAVAGLIQAETRFAVTSCATLGSAVCMLREHAPDIVLLSDVLPGLHGLDGLARFVAAHPGVAVALLATATPPDLAGAVLRTGARGWLSRDATGADLAALMRALAGGGTWPQQPAPAPDVFATLTRREIDALHGLCAGKTNKEIARELELQEVTVKLHVKTLSRKLGARNRTHAAMIGRDGWMV